MIINIKLLFLQNELLQKLRKMQLSIKNTLSLPSKIIEIMGKRNQSVESKIMKDHVFDGVPCVYSTEEVKAMVLERGREIKAGRVKMFPHEEVMREMEQLATSYAD